MTEKRTFVFCGLKFFPPNTIVCVTGSQKIVVKKSNTIGFGFWIIIFKDRHIISNNDKVAVVLCSQLRTAVIKIAEYHVK
jgi:hypothetical protein